MGRKVLAFDVGNTRMKIAFFDDEQVLVRKALANEAWNDLGALLRSHFENYGKPDTCLIASVVRGAGEAITDAVNDVWGVASHCVDAQMDLGIDVAVPNPNQVGIDRLLEASEAFRMVQNAVVVAAIGSAITVDLVTEAGVFRGGTILPGLRLGLEALHRETSLLPAVKLKPPESAVGINTRDCMLAGVVYGAAGAVERLFKEFAPDGGAHLILTGGDAELLGRYINVPYQLEEDLVLRGLIALDQRMKKI